MSETRDEMTLERACEVMNAARHKRNTDWHVNDDVIGRAKGYRMACAGGLGWYDEWTAIAVAERLEREAAPAAPPPGAAEGDGLKVTDAFRAAADIEAETPISRGPSRQWLERAGEIEDQCRSVSVGGLAVDTGMYGVAASLAQEARDRAAAKPQVGEATRRILGVLAGGMQEVMAREGVAASCVFSLAVKGLDVLAALRECGMEDARETPSEPAPCTTPSPSTVVPPDQATWDILCAYLAGEEHHGSDISEGRLTEILRHRIGWGRIEVRAAWFDAVNRGNALIEADHERIRPIREAEAARLMAEAERRRGGSEQTGSDSSSESS